ncbi:MAG: beta-1,3-glucanase family protein [Candidatus Eremiobacteraeota bacterium]|nr:beta-1,3-glucanase family protein [Candidatus Eremiobacteraeota bacterium]
MKGAGIVRKTWSTAVIAMSIACALIITGCTGGSGDTGMSYWGGDGGSGSQVPSIGPTLASATIGPAGGTVTVPDGNGELTGTKVTIPPGALDDTITIGIAADNSPPSKAGFQVVNQSIAFLPSGQQFLKPVTIDDPHYNLPAGTVHKELVVLHRDGLTGEVTTIVPDVASEDGVIFSVLSFSTTAPADPSSFKVTIVNNSGYEDNQVYVTVVTDPGLILPPDDSSKRDGTPNPLNNDPYSVKASDGTSHICVAYYYDRVKREMTQFGDTSAVPPDPNTGYSIPLTAPSPAPCLSPVTGSAHTYCYNQPLANMRSGRVYVSLGNPLTTGIVANLTPPGFKNGVWQYGWGFQAPSPEGEATIFDFMELDSDTPDKKVVANISAVDFYALGLTMHFVATASGLDCTFGFDPTKNRSDFVTALQGMPAAFRQGILYDDAQHVKRVLSPNLTMDNLDTSGDLGKYYTQSIDDGWKFYAKTENQAQTWSYGGFTYAIQPTSTDDTLRIKCTAAPGGTSDGQDQIFAVSKPTSRQVFACTVIQTFDNPGWAAAGKLAALIGAALNRGVFQSYADWGTHGPPGDTTTDKPKPDKYYKAGSFSEYAKVLHSFAVDGKVYAFGFDDTFPADPTASTNPNDQSPELTITIPKYK